MPRAASRSPSRCRNTSPRGLAMSRMPILSPSRLSGRGRRGRIVGLRSDVGSRSTVICVPPCTLSRLPAKAGTQGPRVDRLPPVQARGRPWAPACAGATIDFSGAYLLGYRKAAAGAACGPATDDAGEHPGVAAGADDHQPARPEFVDGLASKRGRPAFGDALGPGDELVARDLAQPVELFIEPRLRPASVPEGAVMLGAHHEQRVAGGRRFDVVDRPQRAGKAARQALGVARLLVDDALQAEPGEHCHRRLARLYAALDR